MRSTLGVMVFVGGAVVLGSGAGCGASGSNSFDIPPPTNDAGNGLSLEGGAPACGDGICNGNETCRTCPRDCGECPKCDLAPSCSNAVGIPTNPGPRADLDQGIDVDAGPDGGRPSSKGATSCRDPELRIRIEKITTYKGGGQIYCIIDGTDGKTSEAAITQKTKDLGSGESSFFDPNSSMFWGSKDLHTTTNNLTVTYNCFVVKSDAWAKVFGAMGDAANKVGGVAGPAYGWAFGVGSVAADAAAAGIQAASGDDLVFNAQQTIDKTELLDLTNGRTWSIRKGGGGLLSKWDWQIDLQSWGCADGVGTPR